MSSWWTFKFLSFDEQVRKITTVTNFRNENERSEYINNFCSRVLSTKNGPKICLQSITKRLYCKGFEVFINAMELLDVVVETCGKPFQLEISTRDFEKDYRTLLKTATFPPCQEKLKSLLIKWADGSFRNDPELWLIPRLYYQLKKEGIEFSNSFVDSEIIIQLDSNGNLVETPPCTIDDIVRKITDGNNSCKDRTMIKLLCSRILEREDGPHLFVDSIVDRLYHSNAHVVLQAISLLGTAVNSCGRSLHSKIATLKFENAYRTILKTNLDEKVQQKLKGFLVALAEGEFTNDADLKSIPRLYNQLKEEGIEFDMARAIRISRQEAEKLKVLSLERIEQESNEVANAIQLSLEDSKSSNSVEPSCTPSAPDFDIDSFYSDLSRYQTSASYDFETVSGNKLTSNAGDTVEATNDNDKTKWKRSSPKEESLFPSVFVTDDLHYNQELNKEDKRNEKMQSSADFNNKSFIALSEEKLKGNKKIISYFNNESDITHRKDQNCDVKTESRVLHKNTEVQMEKILSILNNTDPSAPESDPSDLRRLEHEMSKMGPIIDGQLENIDRRHTQLVEVASELDQAINLYRQLMVGKQVIPQQKYNSDTPRINTVKEQISFQTPYMSNATALFQYYNQQARH